MEMKQPIMNILVNGSPHEIPSSMMLSDLLQSLGLAGKPVVVELNEVAVFPRDYPITLVTDAARVELVTLAAGG
jgi:thiamine biosynthesis protein ThiS